MYNLFVYGSLRSGFQSEAYQYISKYFCLLGNGKVKGLLYDLGTHPVAVPTTSNNFIVGELYSINDIDEFDWAIAQLDGYEGIYPENHEKPLYVRDRTTVYIAEKEIQAWVYWYNGSITNQPIIASGDVMKYKQSKEQ